MIQEWAVSYVFSDTASNILPNPVTITLYHLVWHLYHFTSVLMSNHLISTVSERISDSYLASSVSMTTDLPSMPKEAIRPPSRLVLYI